MILLPIYDTDMLMSFDSHIDGSIFEWVGENDKMLTYQASTSL